MKLPVVGPTYESRARTFDSQRCINLFAELSESGSSKNVARLVGAPGSLLFGTAGTGPIRGCITTAKAPQRCFFVSSNTLFEMSDAGAATSRGTLNTLTGTVSLAENGNQVMIVDGVNGYILNLTTNLLVQITDDAFPNGATVCQFMDTYFLANDPDTGDFYISANNDGLSWGASEKTTVESSPDNLVGMLADHGELILGGPNSMEVYQNTGDAQFPFGRIPGAVMQVGLAAAHTLVSFDNTIVWLGDDVKEGGRFVYKMSGGYRAQRISTVALEKEIASLSDVSEAVFFVYRQEGHEFLMCQFPGMASTWVYDAASQLWHERTWYNDVLSTEERHRGICHTTFGNRNLIGDRESGNIYELRLDQYDDNGVNIHRTRITPHLAEELKYISHNEVVLDVETGVGLEDGTDPKMMMRYSDDGGRTWSYERWKSIGKQGQYKRPLVRWTRCGIARDRVYWFKITDKVQVSINDAYLNPDGEAV